MYTVRLEYYEAPVAIALTLLSCLLCFGLGIPLVVWLDASEWLGLTILCGPLIAAAFAIAKVTAVPVEVIVAKEGISFRPLRGIHPYRRLQGFVEWRSINDVYLLKAQDARPEDLSLRIATPNGTLILNGVERDILPLTENIGVMLISN